MKILVDCFGGDNCPQEAVKGAILALNEKSDLFVGLVGQKDKIEEILNTLSYDKQRLEIIEANDVVTNYDNPIMAIRKKKDSSMVVSLNTLHESDYQGLVSSGNTGALLTGATLIVRLIKGVSRAMLAPIVPTIYKDKYTIVCDAGANVDCKASMLKEFAIMGDIYVKKAFNVENPKIGLLNNGAEEEKGNALTKEAYQILKESKLNFVGNVEATDTVSGVVDVLVTDGFAGNVAIKATEGMAKNFLKLVKDGVKNGGLKAKIGALLLKNTLRGVKSKMSVDEVGGATLLGIQKVIVKAHGSSTAVPFKAAILQASKMVEGDVCGLIEKGMNE